MLRAAEKRGVDQACIHGAYSARICSSIRDWDEIDDGRSLAGTNLWAAWLETVGPCNHSIGRATLLGAIVGLQRERTRKPAGLRTHILVSLATAAFVISCSSVGMSSDGLSRVIQGIITGIGFIGAGSILKLSEQHEIKGLTTAASVWMTAA